MFPKPHLTSHSRMSGSRCEHSIVIIWVMKTFLYSSSLYSCHPFLISFAFFMSLPFLSFIVPILAWNVPLISPISLNRFHSFPFYCFLLLLCIIHLRRPSYLAIRWYFEFSWVYLPFSPLPFTSLLSSAVCKASSDNHFAFLQKFFSFCRKIFKATCHQGGKFGVCSSSFHIFVESIIWVTGCPEKRKSRILTILIVLEQTYDYQD